MAVETNVKPRNMNFSRVKKGWVGVYTDKYGMCKVYCIEWKLAVTRPKSCVDGGCSYTEFTICYGDSPWIYKIFNKNCTAVQGMLYISCYKSVCQFMY